MAGLVAQVVSGSLPLHYIDNCFVEGQAVATPLAPAEPMWLAAVQLSPNAQRSFVESIGLRLAGEKVRAARDKVEQGARRAALGLVGSGGEEAAGGRGGGGGGVVGCERGEPPR